MSSVLPKRAEIPLNLSLLIPTKEQLRTIREVKVTDVFDGPGGNFHDEGLYSTLIFGKVGDDLRDKRFGYIRLKLPILHPVIYSQLIKLRGFYKEILSGTGYATWDEKQKDFVLSDALSGQTGYHFFMSHWKDLVFKRSGSDIRDVRIKSIETYRDRAQLTELLVLPAGLRDIDLEADGRAKSDAINELYHSVLSLARTIPDPPPRGNDVEIYDRVRFNLTLKVGEIYTYIENLVSGKRGLIQNYWASRRVFNGTRNVISSLNTAANDLGAPNRPSFKDVVIGTYQAAKCVLPHTKFFMTQWLLGDVFDTTSNRVQLVDPKTKKLVWVEVGNEEVDRFTTSEGLEGLINELSVVEKRHRPIVVKGHYLALMYLDEAQGFKLIRDIDELPDGADPDRAQPLTYIELVYLSGIHRWRDFPCFVTRYPVENFNSSIPMMMYVKTTTRGELRYPINDDWTGYDEGPIALEYPKLRDGRVPDYHDSTSVSPSTLDAFGGDFDGDMVSVIAAYADNSIEEAKAYFKRREAHIQAGGGLAFSTNIHTLKLTMAFLTGEPVDEVT
jgi:hypothetical protein